jgi:polysaccharide biosynthesis/export protein VpsN
MRLIRLGLWWMAVAMVGAWMGCASNDAALTKSGAKPCSLDEIRLGDQITVTFSDLPLPGIPEQKLRVKDDGTLSLPEGMSIQAAGKKIGVVEKEIVALYVPKLFRRLSVTVKPDERLYFVGGEVKTPNRLPYIGEITVMRAIQSAGDFTDFAKRTKVEIHRADGRLEIVDCKKARKNPRLDLPICPGDSIIVPRRTL